MRPLVHDCQAGLKALFDFEFKCVFEWLQKDGLVQRLTKPKVDENFAIVGRNDLRVIVSRKSLGVAQLDLAQKAVGLLG